MKFHIHRLCVIVLVCALGAVSVFNLAQRNRPTQSELENRTLAAFPSFSFEDFWDGTYTEGISDFFSDTFLGREKLVALSKKTESLYGFPYRTKNNNIYAVLSTGTGVGNTETDLSDDDRALSDLLENAQNQIRETETSIPETEPIPTETKVPAAETEAPAPETEAPAPETEAPTEDEIYGIKKIILSKTKVTLTVGSGTAVTLSTEPFVDSVRIHCRVTDKTIASISVNTDGSLNITAKQPGTCQLVCTFGKLEERCEIVVNEVQQLAVEGAQDEADFLENGLFLYKDAVFTPASFVRTHADMYLRTAEYYGKLFGCRVSVAVAPVSAMMIDDPQILKRIPDQKAIAENMAAITPESVSFVDVYGLMEQHRDEYLFFRTDHHWTALGAYYAYAAFAESVGFTPTPLTDMEQVLIRDVYHGSMYKLTQDERVKEMSDQVYAWMPTKPHTMTVTDSGGATIPTIQASPQNTARICRLSAGIIRIR
ncbi:MAG: DHHW family protein [Eubacteriales bacterium]